MSAALRDRVVVITGASSGLGREAALQFAAEGARVVLAARRAEALSELASQCRKRGAEALAVVTDVTSEASVRALAAQAVEAFGRIDVWVNNAGVTVFGLLEDAPFDHHRRVLETNLYGSMFGARAVIPIFKRQRHGVLINVGSVLSKVGQPFVPSYVISKFGIHGLSEALHTQLADEPDIHVCTIYPFAVDTQHFEAGANEIGRQARALQPVQSPERVARAMVDLARRPRREVHVPRVAALGLVVHRLMPHTIDRLLLHTLRRWHFDEATQPKTEGNLYRPDGAPAAVRGERRPLISTPAFAWWVTEEFVKIVLEGTTRRIQAWARRAGLPRATGRA